MSQDATSNPARIRNTNEGGQSLESVLLALPGGPTGHGPKDTDFRQVSPSSFGERADLRDAGQQLSSPSLEWNPKDMQWAMDSPGNHGASFSQSLSAQMAALPLRLYDRKHRADSDQTLFPRVFPDETRWALSIRENRVTPRKVPVKAPAVGNDVSE